MSLLSIFRLKFRSSLALGLIFPWSNSTFTYRCPLTSLETRWAFLFILCKAKRVYVVGVYLAIRNSVGVCRHPLYSDQNVDRRLPLASSFRGVTRWAFDLGLYLAKNKLGLRLCSASILQRKHLLSLVLVLDLTWSNSTFTYRCPLSSVKELFWLISLASN